ncbi:hypothetical protein ACFVS2_20300 [Brevibacillus sp. NPDC058079]|uniref:hypothetical protein n=1 Tax=Brevibacillus sp. NPDC058079 TaxID=3346330 RepID=UPI0036EF16D0
MVRRIGEVCYAIFLLINGAVIKERAFQPKEYDYDLTPVGNAIQLISTHLFKTELSFGGNVGTFHFLRKQTMSSVVAKTISPYYQSGYIKKDRRRIAYFDLPFLLTTQDMYTANGNDELESEFTRNQYTYVQHLKIILRAIIRLGEMDARPFLEKLRELVVNHLVMNELLPHEQNMFFGNRNYADQLYFLILAIDNHFD